MFRKMPRYYTMYGMGISTTKWQALLLVETCGPASKKEGRFLVGHKNNHQKYPIGCVIGNHLPATQEIGLGTFH